MNESYKKRWLRDTRCIGHANAGILPQRWDKQILLKNKAEKNAGLLFFDWSVQRKSEYVCSKISKNINIMTKVKKPVSKVTIINMCYSFMYSYLT